MPVDMRAKPYYLDDEAVQWVEDTIASMSLEEKIGQLFFNMGSSRTEDRYRLCGIGCARAHPRYVRREVYGFIGARTYSRKIHEGERAGSVVRRDKSERVGEARA